MSLKLGILGYPIHHTLSPVLHGKLMALTGLSGQYDVFSTPPEELVTAILRLRKEGYVGLNLTIPHKVAAMSLCDHLSPQARQIQAVNTITLREDGIWGENTDVTGFLESFPHEVRQSMPHRSALVLGAGGASRAVLAAFITAAVPHITLAARSPERASATLAMAETMIRETQSKTRLQFIPWNPEVADLEGLESFQIVVNTTPIGMSPDRQNMSPLKKDAISALPSAAFVYDLIYRPQTPRLIQESLDLGLAAMAGLDMLILQGVAAFEIWTGQKIPPTALPELRHTLQKEMSAL